MCLWKKTKTETSDTQAVDWVAKLIVKRYFFGPKDTLGKLYIVYADNLNNEEFICYILEDKVRNEPDTPDDFFEKVYGETAIPYGIYEVKLTNSPRFGKILPELLDVPHFSGVRIHSGNQASDSEGCLICGDTPKESCEGSWVSNSKTNVSKLLNILNPLVKKGKVIIEIMKE